jgi:hypothetical protein
MMTLASRGFRVDTVADDVMDAPIFGIRVRLNIASGGKMIKSWRTVLLTGLTIAALIAVAVVCTIQAKSATVGLWVGVATGVAGILIPNWNERKKSIHEILRNCYLNVRGTLPRVKEISDPTALGVYRAALSGGSSVPAYVRRDVDSELRTALEKKGFILLVGDSAAGKTRTAFEAIAAIVPAHTLVAPYEHADLKPILSKAGRMRHCVLWLDDIEVFLRPDGLRREGVERFLEGNNHHLIMATIQRHELDSRSVDEDRRRMSRLSSETLEMAQRIDMESGFSEQERKAAAKIANDDPLVADALSHAIDFRIPEFISSAPLLLARWHNGRDDEATARGAALVSAAVDCKRAGLMRPIPRPLIEEIHEAYIPKWITPADTLSEAWAWATAPQRTGALLVPPDPREIEPGDPEAVTVFRYLVDQTNFPRVPDATLMACFGYANDTELARIGRSAYGFGRYQIACNAYKRSIGIRANRGATDTATLASRDNLARGLRALEKLGEAEEEQRAILTIREELLISADGDPKAVSDRDELLRAILANRDNLGRTLRAQGKLNEATKEHSQVLGIRRDILRLPRTDPDVLTSRMYLAQVKGSRGAHEEAADEFREILKLRTHERGEDDVDVLITRNYLAVELMLLGKLVDAEIEFREVINRRTKMLGADHPDTLMSRCNLARTWRNQGRLVEAASEHKAVLQLREEILGPQHPYTQASRGYLAEILQMLPGGRTD